MTLGTAVAPLGVLLVSFGSAALEIAGLGFARAESLNTMPEFIRALAAVVERELR